MGWFNHHLGKPAVNGRWVGNVSVLTSEPQSFDDIFVSPVEKVVIFHPDFGSHNLKGSI